VYSPHLMKERQISVEQAFGRVVQARRKRIGLSQEEFGFKSGLHRTFISQIERGLKSPSLRTLMALAQSIGTDASTLLRETERLVKP
jgi:transcriptional regulator with XRE-family HTH domain